MSPPDYPAPVLSPPVGKPAGTPASPGRGATPDLFRQTLRMVAVLVAACVVFVGALSVVAVAITSRAVGPRAGVLERAPDDTATKKPLSI